MKKNKYNDKIDDDDDDDDDECDNHDHDEMGMDIDNVDDKDDNGDDDDDDLEWIRTELMKYPVWERNRELCIRLVTEILPLWKHDLDYYHTTTMTTTATAPITQQNEQQNQQPQPTRHNSASTMNTNQQPEQPRPQATTTATPKDGESNDDHHHGDAPPNTSTTATTTTTTTMPTTTTTTTTATSKRKNPWRNIRKRIAKEFNECEPILVYVQQVVKEYNNDDADPNTKDNKKMTIIDLCSGFGICSMILSDLLDPRKVGRMTLIDYKWPSTTRILPKKTTASLVSSSSSSNPHTNNLSTDHLTRRTWPIPLIARKRNFKAGRQVQHIHQHDINQSPGPVLVLGIHLCKSLSIRAIHLFHNNPKVQHFLLKPCCLPGKRMLDTSHNMPSSSNATKDSTNDNNGNDDESDQNNNKKKKKRGIPILWTFPNGFQFGPADLYTNNNTSNTNTTIMESKDTRNDHGDDKEYQHQDREEEDDVLPKDDTPVGCCCQGCTTTSSSHKDPNFTNQRFAKWVEYLRRGCCSSLEETDGIIDKQTKEQADSLSSSLTNNTAATNTNTIIVPQRTTKSVIRVEVKEHVILKHHFQNKIIYCKREDIVIP